MNLQRLTVLAQQEGSDAVGLIGALIYLAVIVLLIAGMWQIFTKAGKPGWAAIIPIYNLIVLLEISGKPIWWILLWFIPCVNIVVVVLVYIDLAKAFGQGVGFAIGLLLLPFIFFPLLGFGDYRYQGVRS